MLGPVGAPFPLIIKIQVLARVCVIRFVRIVNTTPLL